MTITSCARCCTVRRPVQSCARSPVASRCQSGPGLTGRDKKKWAKGQNNSNFRWMPTVRNRINNGLQRRRQKCGHVRRTEGFSRFIREGPGSSKFSE